MIFWFSALTKFCFLMLWIHFFNTGLNPEQSQSDYSISAQIDGWEERTDSDGCLAANSIKWYYDKSTGDILDPPSHPSRMPPGWQRIEKHGSMPYYHNKLTQESLWRHPSILPPDWQYIDQQSDQPYYKNKETGDTLWTHPESFGWRRHNTRHGIRWINRATWEISPGPIHPLNRDYLYKIIDLSRDATTDQISRACSDPNTPSYVKNILTDVNKKNFYDQTGFAFPSQRDELVRANLECKVNWKMCQEKTIFRTLDNYNSDLSKLKNSLDMNVFLYSGSYERSFLLLRLECG